MARKGSPTIQEELYPHPAPPAREELDDARLLDLDVEEQSPFLRGQKRVSARRSSLPKKTANRLLWAMAAAALLCILGVIAAMLYAYGERSWRFRVESSDNIEVTGTQNVTKAQIMEVMGSDIGRNIFFIPLEQQQASLEQIPWVESASVMRFVPNRLKVEIQERTPVAFARLGAKIELIDAGGTLMDLPQKRKYSFPVILGMNPGEPLSTRAPRMKAYNEVVADLDSSGARYSGELSEVDLSDLEDVKVRVNDAAGDVLVHLGSSNYLSRYKIYVAHVEEWRQQFQKLESVDLRYDNQIIVNPDMPATTHTARLIPASSKGSPLTGMKPAVLKTPLPANTVPRVGPKNKPLPKPVFEMPESKLHPKPADSTAKKPVAKPRVKKAVARKPVTKGGKATAASKKPAGKSATAKKQVPPPSHGMAISQRPTPTVPAHAIPKPSAAIAKQQTSQAQN